MVKVMLNDKELDGTGYWCSCVSAVSLISEEVVYQM